MEQDSVSHHWCGALWTLLFNGLLLHGHLDLYVQIDCWISALLYSQLLGNVVNMGSLLFTLVLQLGNYFSTV